MVSDYTDELSILPELTSNSFLFFFPSSRQLEKSPCGARETQHRQKKRKVEKFELYILRQEK